MSMATPLRKDRPEEELTTADLAQGEPNRADDHPETKVPKPVISAHGPVQGKVQEIRQEDVSAPLFPNNELENLRNRWKEIQTGFVDEPRKAVEQADGLVASAMKRLAEVFADERSKLEKQWDRGDTVSTEDLRVALQRYRSFFHRLLSV
jgi:hypothetical protein